MTYVIGRCIHLKKSMLLNTAFKRYNMNWDIWLRSKGWIFFSSIWWLADLLMLTPRLTCLNLCINGEASPSELWLHRHGWSTETGLSGNFSGKIFNKFEWIFGKNEATFLPPWGGRPPLRRGSAAVPPTRSSPAPAAVFAIAQTGGSSAPSQSTTEPNLASDNTPQNGGFIRGKTPPDTRHQTPTPDTRHQTPPTHRTPKNGRRPQKKTRKTTSKK
jgi:hypothetical protein